MTETRSLCVAGFSLASIFKDLHLDSSKAALCEDWPRLTGVSLESAKRFLEPGFVTSMARAAALSTEQTEELVSFAPRIASEPALLAFFAYCLHRVRHDVSLTRSWEEQWPPLDEHLGQDAGLVNVLVMLAALPEALEGFDRIGLPARVVADTLADLRRWMESDVYFQNHGRWGITPWIARWLTKHWRGIMVQLGRLQFSPSRFSGPLEVFRHRTSGQVVALANSGQRLGIDGQAWGPCCGSLEPSWVSERSDTETHFGGHCLDPTGHAERLPVALPKSQWFRVLATGDPMLSIHVPTGGSLAFEDCGDSFRQALEFFPRYYPEVVFKGFATASWLMDPRWGELLAPQSNIVRLQSELFLYPGIQGDNDQIYQRVFGWGVTDARAVEWKTSLQKAVGPVLESGGHFHGGYCFLLKEDLDWGRQPYRTYKKWEIS